MALKKVVFKTTEAHKNLRLDDVLFNSLPDLLKQPLSKGKVRKLIVAGAVYLNGRRVRIASKAIEAGVQLQLYVDLVKLNSDQKSKDTFFEMKGTDVLFEDAHLIVFNKPAGLPTQPTLDDSRNNLYTSAKKFISKRANLPESKVYLGMHHRLDKDTSGVILMTKTQEANPGVAALFTTHSLVKVYNALSSVSSVRPPGEWEVKNYLGHSKEPGKKTKICSVRSGGDFAHTQFKLIETFPNALWVEARPLTGRTHQIRVHLSEQGMPILGDSLYFRSQSNQIPRLMLHAVSLTFDHPIYQNSIRIESPFPEDFKQCLKQLRRKDGGS